MLNSISTLILPVLILTILCWGITKKQPIYEQFIDGAKDGFNVAIKIIPYLVAIIVAISVFKASGLMNGISNLISGFTTKIGLPTEVLPLIFTRSLSGSATLGLFSELVNNIGTDCYTAKLAAIIVGSSETTFYVLSVYFGSVGILKFRYALLTGLIADFAGIVFAVITATYFFST